MVFLDPLGPVVQEMLQGGYADRVKKLVYFTYTRTWANDAGKLSEEELRALLEQLCRESATLEDLGRRFREAISRLNKKAEYARVAKLLLSKLQPLYQSSQSSQRDPGNPFPSSARAPSPGVAPPLGLPLGYSGLQLRKQAYDPFEVRAWVMQQTSPLRAKLVLFTALHHKLEPTVQGLAALRRYSLDELLKALYDACSSPQELEGRLQQAVQQLQEPEQDAQAANAVLQILQPLYTYVLPEAGAGGGLAAETSNANLDWLDGESAAGGVEASRITWLEPEIPECEEGEPEVAPVSLPGPPAIAVQELPELCRQLLQRSAGALMVTLENTLSDLGNALDESLQDGNPAHYLNLKHQVLRGFLKEVEGSAALFQGILSKLEQSEWSLLRPAGQGGQPGEIAKMPLQVGGDPHAALRQVLATSELARQKPQLEQEVMRLVRHSIGAIKTAIENALDELGQALDEQFQSRPPEEALILKYQTLRAFLQEVEEISSKFAAFLARLEEAERRLFGLV